MKTNNFNFIKSFEELHDEQSFVDLLNEISYIIYGKNHINFTINQIRYHSNSNLNSNRYVNFQISKKTGGSRTIHAPNKNLKIILTCINILIQNIYTTHRNAFGFVIGKSIVDNAKKHSNRNYVFNADLKDFFPSIDQARIWERLKHPPFNLDDSKIKIRNLIAGLVCHSMEVDRFKNNEWIKETRNVLPQGAPTSPFFSNLICERLDRKLTGLAKRFGVQYSRYADDITFSSDHNVYQEEGDFIVEFKKIIQNQNFHLKNSKTRLQKRDYRQEVTGIIVNETTNVRRKYIKTLRLWIHRWEKFGYENAYKLFLEQYFQDKGHLKKNLPIMENVISGKLLYLKMVLGENNSLFKKLNFRFKKLIEINQFDEHQSIFKKLNTKEKINVFKEIVLDLFDNGLNETLIKFNNNNKVNHTNYDLENELFNLKRKPKDISISQILNENIFNDIGIEPYSKNNIIQNFLIKIIKNSNNIEKIRLDLNINEKLDFLIIILTREKIDLILDLWQISEYSELFPNLSLDTNFIDYIIKDRKELLILLNNYSKNR